MTVREPPSFLASAHSSTPISAKLKRVDWVGSATLVLSLGSLLLGLTLGEKMADPGSEVGDGSEAERGGAWEGWRGWVGMWGFIVARYVLQFTQTSESE